LAVQQKQRVKGASIMAFIVRTRDLVKKKMIESGKKISIIGKVLIAFRKSPSIIGNKLLGASN